MTARRRIARALTALSVLLLGAAAPASDAPRWVPTARSAAAGLAEDLKTELQAAIAEGGPLQGIETCRIRAPEIADARSGTGMVVGRTALRVRNPANAPDAWEREIMEDFQRRLAAGTPPERLEAWTETVIDGRPTGRWMKAIPTQPMCVTCHGATLAPALAETIRAAYPDDRATGFAPGELRGAFTVELVLEPEH